MSIAISVVIPTYNYGAYVGQAIDSALAQTHAPLEVIVVDDGSTDDTPARLAAYGDRIRAIRQENAGLSAARNAGIAAARGTHVALLDSDDAWHPRKLELQVRALEQFPGTAVVGTGTMHGTAEAPPTSPEGWPEVPSEASIPISLEMLVLRIRFAPSSALIDRLVLEEVGPFDTALRSAEDRDMWIRIAAKYPVRTVGAPLLWYRLHNASMSRNASRMEENERRVLDKSFRNLEPLRGHWVLRRKALALANFAAAWRYDQAGQRGRALACNLRSLFLWPLPYRDEEILIPNARIKLAARMALASLAILPPR
jgi:glycosyltransferase involved in cell wall biosynthesis